MKRHALSHELFDVGPGVARDCQPETRLPQLIGT